MAKLAFGKYAGQDIEDVPIDYLEWLKKQALERIKEVDAELSRREMVELASQGMLEKIVQAGYRALAQKLHPDVGGRTQDFQELQGAMEQLKIVLKEVESVQRVK